MQTSTHKLVEADGDRLAAVIGRQSDDVVRHRSRLRPCTVSRTVSWPGTASVDDVYDVIVSGRATGEDGWIRWRLGEGAYVNVVRQRPGEHAFGITRLLLQQLQGGDMSFVRTLYFTALPEEAAVIFRRLEQLARRQVARRVAEAHDCVYAEHGGGDTESEAAVLLEAPEYYIPCANEPRSAPQECQPLYGSPSVLLTHCHEAPSKTYVGVKLNPLVGGIHALMDFRCLPGILSASDPEVKKAAAEITARLQKKASRVKARYPLPRITTFVAPTRLDAIQDVVEPYDYVYARHGSWEIGELVAGLGARLRPGQQTYRILPVGKKPTDMTQAAIYFNATPDEAEAVRLRLEQVERKKVKRGFKVESADLLEAPEYTSAPVTGGVTDYKEPQVRVYDKNSWGPNNELVPDETIVEVVAYSWHGAIPPIRRSKKFKPSIYHASAAIKAAIAELTAKVRQDIASKKVKSLDRTPTIVAPWSYIDKVRPFVEPFDYVRCVSGNSNSDENANSEAVAGLMRRLQPGQQVYRVLTSHGQPGDYMDRSCLYFNATPDEAEAVRLQLERVGRQRARAGVKESMHPKLLKKRFDPRGEPKVLPDIDDDPDTEIGVPSPDADPEPDDEPGPWRRTIEPGEEPGPKACDVVDELVR